MSYSIDKSKIQTEGGIASFDCEYPVVNDETGAVTYVHVNDAGDMMGLGVDLVVSASDEPMFEKIMDPMSEDDFVSAAKEAYNIVGFDFDTATEVTTEEPLSKSKYQEPIKAAVNEHKEKFH